MRDNGLEYELTTPAGSMDFTRSASAVTRLKQISFGAQVRGSKSSRSQQHGARFEPSFKDGGVLSVMLDVNPLRAASDAAIEAARTEIIAHANELLDDDGVLGWTNRGGSTPLALTGLRTLTDPVFQVDGHAWRVLLLLESPRPFAEDASATVVDSAALSVGGGGFTIPLTIPFTFTASSGGDLEVTHAGDFKLAYPVLRAYGPITNPHVVNQTTGKRLVFEGSIAAGDYWEIDLFERSVLLNGVTKVRALDASRSTWWACVRGANDLQLAGSGYTSSTFLRAYMKSSWG